MALGSPQAGSITGQNWRKRRPGWSDWIQGQHGSATDQVIFERGRREEQEWRQWQQEQAERDFQQRQDQIEEQNRQWEEEQKAQEEAAWRGMGPTVMDLTSRAGGGAGDGGVIGDLGDRLGGSWAGGADFGNIISGGGTGFGLSRMFGDPDDPTSRGWWGAGGGALGSFLSGGSWTDIIGGGALGGLLGMWH